MITFENNPKATAVIFEFTNDCVMLRLHPMLRCEKWLFLITPSTILNSI